MLYLTIALFAAAAVVGVIILKNWFTGQNTSRSVIYGHGIAAAIALSLLLFYFFTTETKSLQTSLVLFVFAALMGFYMFFRDMKGKMSATWIAVVHALLAGAGFIFLVLNIL